MADIATADPQASNDEAGTSETATGARLRSFIERIERLEEEKKALADDIKEVYSEAKGQASTRRPCARSSPCGRRIRMIGQRKMRCWTRTNPPSG